MSLPVTTPTALYSSTRSKTYAVGAVLGADVLFNIDAGSQAAASRYIRVGTTGNLVLYYGNDDAGNPISDTIYNVVVGELLRVEATGLKAAGSTCQQISVFF